MNVESTSGVVRPPALPLYALGEAQRQRINDDGHLEALRILHWCYAGFCFSTALSLLFFAAVVFGGVAGALESFEGVEFGEGQELIPYFVGFYGIVYLGWGVISMGLAMCHFLVGLWEGRLERRVATMALAVVGGFSFPLGTGLAVYSMMILTRPSVRLRFEHAEREREKGEGEDLGD